MTETRDERRRKRKRAAARGVEQFREHIGGPAPLTMTPQAVYHWTRDDQADALVEARTAEPYTGFVMRLLALCTLPRTNPGDRFQYFRTNGPWRLPPRQDRRGEAAVRQPAAAPARVDLHRGRPHAIADARSRLDTPRVHAAARHPEPQRRSPRGYNPTSTTR